MVTEAQDCIAGRSKKDSLANVEAYEEGGLGKQLLKIWRYYAIDKQEKIDIIKLS